jgi:molybdopterin converting factor small subunit
LTVEVRIRLGTGIAQLAPAPVLHVDLPDGATVDDLFDKLAAKHPDLAPALGGALPIVQGVHVERGQALAHGTEVALITPVSGG